MNFNLAVIPAETAGSSPGKPVAVCAGGQMSYGELDGMSDRLATGLARAGLRPGDVAGLQLPSIPQFLIAYFGILNAGGAVMTLNVMLEAPEVAFQLQDSGARFLLTFEAILDDVARGAAAAGLPGIYAVGHASDDQRALPFGQLLAAPAMGHRLAVVGIPGARLGEEVMAVVTLRPGGSLTAPDLVACCRERLAAYKYPRVVEFRDALPRNAPGKVVKDELVRDHGEKDSRNAAGGGGPWNG